MRSIGRRGFSGGMLSLLAAACGGRVAADDGAPSTTPDAGRGVTPPPYVPLPAPEPFLPVDTTSPPPEVVWSWTTAAQATEIRKGSVLFTVESSPTMGRGYLFELLEERAGGGDGAAARLVGRELAKGRFGWSNPWATVRGAAEGESYGLELLAIRMKPDTLYARVSARSPAISFVDARGAAVGTGTALANFELVGGILFDNDLESGKGCGTNGPIGTAPGGGNLFYREIYLGNEARIASFSHRTEDILAAIDASRVALLDRDLRTEATTYPRTRAQLACDTAAIWRGDGPSQGAVARYLAGLAFATGRYDPTPANLDALVAELDRARFTPDPFVVTR